MISPIAIGADHDRKYPRSLFYGKYEESLRFAKVYQPICRSFGVEFLDAAQYARASETDCLHMDAENHRLLAESDFELKDALHLSYDVKANYKAGTNAERYFPAFAEKMGFRYEKTKDAEALRRCLRTGGAAIVRVSGNREGYQSVFSDRSKHYITAIAEERDGRIVVLDPAYEEGKFEKEDRKGKVEVKGRGMGVCEMKVLEEETEPFEIPFFLFWRG